MEQSAVLKQVLFANALSCALFGVVFVALSQPTAEFIGTPPALLVQLLGSGLLLNAGMLFASTLHDHPDRNVVMMFIYGDAAWVAATALLIPLGIWINTGEGIAAAFGVAAMVGTFAILQWRHLPPQPQ